MYEYRVRPIRVLDGDTVEFDIDLGLNIHKIDKLRFYGVNTPETNSVIMEDRARAKTAKEYVETVLMGRNGVWPLAAEVKVQTMKPNSTDKYGRWLGTVFYKTLSSDWINLNEELVIQGLATRY